MTSPEECWFWAIHEFFLKEVGSLSSSHKKTQVLFHRKARIDGVNTAMLASKRRDSYVLIKV